MHLKLNLDKIECSKFWSKQQLQKSTSTPLNAYGDLVNLSEVVRYLGGYLEQTLRFKEHIKQKTKKAMANLIKIRCLHYPSINAVHINP